MVLYTYFAFSSVVCHLTEVCIAVYDISQLHCRILLYIPSVIIIHVVIFCFNFTILLCSVISFCYSYDSRIMISSASLRKKLRSGSVIDDDLINLVESEQENWLKPVLLEFNGVELSKLPSAWKQLMRDISASTPAIGLVDPTKDISVICQQLIDDPVSASLLAEVKAAIPTIYNLLRVDICVVKLIKPLLLHLREKVSQIMSYQPHSLPDIPQAESSAEKKPHTLPRLPQLHQRGSYELDRKKKVTVCTKKAPKHRTLTPGIFTISCMHGEAS